MELEAPLTALSAVPAAAPAAPVPPGPPRPMPDPMPPGELSRRSSAMAPAARCTGSEAREYAPSEP